MGVAIPHVKLKALDRVVCTLAIHGAGLEWSAVDAQPVHIFFAVLRPERDNEQYNEKDHKEMMSWIASLARSADFRSFALQAKKKSDQRDLLKEMSSAD
jgi:PTS system nitrogen regulatory IIA component